MSELLSVADALHLILNDFSPKESQKVPLELAYQRVLAEDVHSTIDLPSFSNSSMDGFAVRAADLDAASPDNPVTLVVVGDAPAGQIPGIRVRPGQAVRIMTGAAIPGGSDAVVPVEQTRFSQRGSSKLLPETVEILNRVLPGDYIRPVGQDVRRSDLVLTKGSRLAPQHIGMLGMLGKAEVSVHRKPRVVIFASGDELIPVGGSLSTGRIYDSNTPMLVSLLKKYSAEVVNLGIALDDIDEVGNKFDRAVKEGADLILSSAGVSVGSFDYVRSVLMSDGELSFWRVNMRPGKPLAYGRYKGFPFIGLPGNPVSAFVGFEIFVRPVLMKLQGVTDWQKPAIHVEIEESIESDGRESYLRAIVRNEQGKWLGKLTGHQGSGNLRSLVEANALLLIPSEVKSLPVGSLVNGWLLEDYY
jgi:molybdopterin molybdotransferase